MQSSSNAATARRRAPSNDRAQSTFRSILALLALLALLACGASAAEATAAGIDDTKRDVARSTSLAGAPHGGDAASADLNDAATYRLPGLIDARSTVDQLRQRFGAANVAVKDIDGAEGAVTRGIVLFDADRRRRAEIFPADADQLRGIATIRVSGRDSRWHLDTGVRLGMNLDALVALNGKPISFSGLDWDYGGSIADWHGGRLAPRDGDGVFRAITLSHADDAAPDSFPLGDATFRSDSPRFPKQGTALYVAQLMVSFPENPGQ